MVKFKACKYFTILSLIINIFLFRISVASAYTPSQAECTLELNSLRILSENNKDLKLPMASTTKIITALTVIENFDVNQTVTVKKSSTNIEGSSIYLKEGERLTVKELLYGLMLRSGNDSAECLAQSLTSRDNFINLMNETAKKYGAFNSNFTNPHGLHDDDHYTTAYDLALITAGAMKNPIFSEIVSTKKVNISNETENYDRVLINKNKMLSFYEGANGVKTGYTKKAGRCLVSSANRNGMTVISVVLNSPQMWERSTELLDYSFNNYKLYELVNKEDLNNRIFKSEHGKVFSVILQKNFSYPLLQSEKSEINYKINGLNVLEFFKKPQKSGVFEIYLKNKLIFSQNIFIIL